MTTPKCDLLDTQVFRSADTKATYWRDLARQLERENQELREALKELQGAGIKADFWMADHENSELHKRGGSQNRQSLTLALAAARAALGEGLAKPG